MNPPIPWTTPSAKSARSLKYSAFVYGTPLKVSIQPFSGKSLAIAPYILSGSPTESPEITISYPTSKVTSFDMKSLAHACATATQQGLVVPALRCKIFYTGTKVSGDKVTFEATFNPDGLLDIGDISLFKVKLQEITFPPRFRGLKSFTLTVLEPPEPGLVQVGFDDVKYTAHVKE
jgi:hypothetical protein